MSLFRRIRLLFGYYHWCLMARKRFKLIVKSGGLMDPGLYYIVCATREYLINTKTPYSFLKNISVPYSKPLITLKIRERYNGGYKYRAQIAMTTNNGVRYFNYRDCTTYRCFSGPEESVQYGKAVELFSPYFKLTYIKHNTVACVEHVVKSRPRSEWNTTEILRNYFFLFDRYTEYLNSTPKRSSILKIVDIVDDSKSLVLRLKELMPQMSLNYIFSHCDLHFGNTLFDGNDLFLIDFEESKEEVFFYDMFNVMYVDYMEYNNSFLLDKYLSGDAEMTKHFERFFTGAGIRFEPKEKCGYLAVYLYLRLLFDLKTSKRKYEGEELEKRIAGYINNENEILTYILKWQ